MPYGYIFIVKINMEAFIQNHVIELITLIGTGIAFIAVTKYKGTSTDNKIDNLSTRMDGFQNTLQLIQIENTRTSERSANTTEQLKEIKEQLKEIKSQHGQNN